MLRGASDAARWNAAAPRQDPVLAAGAQQARKKSLASFDFASQSDAMPSPNALEATALEHLRGLLAAHAVHAATGRT